MRLSLQHAQILTMLCIGLATLSSAQALECIRYEQGSNICPLGVSQIRHLNEHAGCQSSSSQTATAVRNCQEHQAQLASDHWLYGNFGIMGVAAMSPDEVQSAVETTLGELKSDMLDEIARIDFEENFLKGREINTRELSSQWFKLKALSARGGADLERFNAFKASEEVATVRRILRIGNQSQFIPSNFDHSSHTIYRPYWVESQSFVDGTDVNKIDIANRDWEHMPQSAFINGRPANIKKRFTDTANVVYEKLEGQLRTATTMSEFNRAFDILKEEIVAPDGRRIRLTEAQVRRIRSTFKTAGQYAQTQRTGVSMSRIRPSQKDSPHRTSKNRLRVFGAAAGVLGLASVGATVMSLAIENQAQCDSAYPYTPVSYHQPAVTGDLPISMKCQIDEGQLGQSYPSKTRKFLNLPPDQMVVELNSRPSDPNSVCSYFIKDFNRRFNCTNLQDSAPNTTPTSQPSNVTQ